jgi:hypothetical protein
MKIELDVGDGSYVVRLPACGISISIRDEVAMRGRKIHGVGQFGLERSLWTTRGAEVKRAFDPASFDPEVSRAVLRFAVAKLLTEAGIPWWRRLFRRSALEIRWRDWDQLGSQDRVRFLAFPPASRIAVNGKMVLGPRVDVVLLRTLFGSKANLGGN